jgi:hypothetical protein
MPPASLFLSGKTVINTAEKRERLALTNGGILYLVTFTELRCLTSTSGQILGTPDVADKDEETQFPTNLHHLYCQWMIEYVFEQKLHACFSRLDTLPSPNLTLEQRVMKVRERDSAMDELEYAG